MRKVYDTNGNDVTSTVLSFLRTNRTLYMCDLLSLSTWIWWAPQMSPQTATFYFSFGDFPVQTGFLQTGPGAPSAAQMYGSTIPAIFLPQPMTRDKFEYGIGFTAQNADIDWFCGDTLVPVVVSGLMSPYVYVSGGLNSQYPISALGHGQGISPAAVQVKAGRRISIKWVGGLASGSGSGGLNSGFGVVGFAGNSSGVFPGAYVPNVTAAQSAAGQPWFGALIGGFADSTGQLVEPPFLIGTGIDIDVPIGATQLLMGINDNFDTDGDNIGQWLVLVSGGGYCSNQTQPTWQQGLAAGMFDECSTNIYRAFFNGDPKQGGTLLGTTLMYRGFIREAETAQDHAKLTISSLLDLFQEVKVPTQIIQPGNRTTPYVPSGVTYTVSGLDTINSTASVLRFSSGGGIADHALQDAYLLTGGVSSWTPVNGQPPPVFLRIRDNVTISGVLYVYLYEPTIIPIPQIGAGFGATGGSISLNVGILLQKPLSNSYGAPGFPSVPVPEIGI